MVTQLSGERTTQGSCRPGGQGLAACAEVKAEVATALAVGCAQAVTHPNQPPEGLL